MTPAEFRQARLALGLSQSQLARVLNVATRTVQRWEEEDGTRPPNPIACRVLAWLDSGYRPLEWPAPKHQTKNSGNLLNRNSKAAKL